MRTNRKTHEEKLKRISTTGNTFYEYLIEKTPFTLNYFLKMLKYISKFFILKFFEIIEYIDLIIDKEKPDLIFISEEEPSYSKALYYRLNFPKNKIFYIRSHFDKFIRYKFNIQFFIEKLVVNLYKMLRDFSNCWKNLKNNNNDKHVKYNIGIVVPRLYLFKGIKSIYKKLIERNLKIKIYELDFFNYNKKFKDFSFYYKCYFCILLRFIKFSFKEGLTFNYINNLNNEYYITITKRIFKEILLNYFPKVLYWTHKISLEFKKYKFKLIITSNEYFPETQVFYHFCSLCNVITLFLPHVGIPQLRDEITPKNSDIIIVDGQVDKEYLVENGVDKNKIKVFGSVLYEDLSKEKIKEVNKVKDLITNKIITLDLNKKKILLTTNPISFRSNQIILEKVINTLKKIDGIQLIVKLHPRENGYLQKKVIKNLRYNTILVKNINIYKIIKSVDILLTQDSVTILDAMVLGTPIICLDFINKRMRYSGRHVYNDEKYIIKAYNENDLYEKLTHFLNNQEELEKYKLKLKSNLNLFLNLKENYSPTQRIIDEIMKLI
ncbi:MAG: UDP-N-acetylglucosamine 2-epimerase [Candidatus Helarchaeota archaeon]